MNLLCKQLKHVPDHVGMMIVWKVHYIFVLIILINPLKHDEGLKTS